MKIRLARIAGFCMGVRRAVDMALDLQRLNPPQPIVTYGPLIHNPQTLQLLESRGIREVASIDEIRGGTVVIRAHGISPQERRILESKGVDIIDATCPRVARVQSVIRKHAARGQFCIIVGDEDHPEVKGLLGFATSGGLVISSTEELDRIESLDPDREICVVAQTTQEERTFNEVVEQLRRRCARIKVVNTICDSTRKRQTEASRLARQVDLVLVVGGKGSGNTRRLVKVAQAQGVPALHVETAEAIPASALTGVSCVGVTAGASTPNWQIQRVIFALKQIGMRRIAGPTRVLRKLADVAVMTYLWAALAGGGLTASCLALQGREVTWLPLAAAVLFVISMHLMNRIMERSGAMQFNTPEMAAFYATHRSALTALGVLSCLGALIAGWWLGTVSFLLLCGMIGAGLLYTVPLGPDIWRSRRKWTSLKDIPGSKTPLVALGWAMAAAVLPVVGSEHTLNVSGVAVSFIFAAGMVFWRTALSDLLDIQGDRIVGRETIPILIGPNRCERLLVWLLVFLSVLIVASSWIGWTTAAGYWLVVNTVGYGICYRIYRGRHFVDRLSFDGMLDGNLLLAGMICIVYGAM